MKPTDIYEKKPIQTTKNLYPLLSGWHRHVPEIDLYDIDDDRAEADGRITIKIHYDPYIDGERCCTIGSAWLDDKPVMIFRHGGRSGHDQHDRFITDFSLYGEMVKYLRMFCEPDAEKIDDIVNKGDDIEALNYFYGRKFEPSDFDPGEENK